MNVRFPLVIAFCGTLLVSCSTTEQSAHQQTGPSKMQNEELALHHFLEGSVLDAKQEYAKAILEYQDALRYKEDAAAYHAIAKDYSILGKNELAMEMGKEAVRIDPNNRTYHESLAQIYLNAFEIDGAIGEYEAIVRIDPQHEAGWIDLARLWQVKSPEKAIGYYQLIIDKFGPSPDVYFQLAQLYGGMNRLDKMTEALHGLLSTDPGNFEVKKALGDTYLRRDSVDTALKIYDELTELHPENLEVRASIAHAYLVKQDYEHAAQQFETVMQKDTLSADDELRFGQIFVSFIERDSAVAPYALKLFERISANYPADWRPHWFIAAISNVVRDDSTQMVHYEKVRQLAKWNPDGWVGVASVYYDRGQFADAIEILNEAKRIVPDEFRVYFLLGISYQRIHLAVDAAGALEKALQLNDKHPDALTALGLVYDELKRYEDSDSMYERAIRIDPQNHLLLNNYGYSLAERGIQLERALKMSKEAVRQQPLNQSYLDTYGWIYYKMGQYDEAERYVKKAVDLGSVSTVIHEHLGDIYFKLSQKEKAKEYWQKAVDLDGANTSAKDKIERGSL